MRPPGVLRFLAPLLVGVLWAQSTADFDVVWTSPSQDHHGSMPLGNGEVAANVWVETDGDVHCYLARTDAWGDNGRLLKVGKLRFTFDPPLAVADRFEQRLELRRGRVVIEAGSGPDATQVAVWIDAHRACVCIDAQSQRERTATASIELWRTERTPYPEATISDLLEDRSKPNKLLEQVFVEPDTIVDELDGAIAWYHWNQTSVGPTRIAAVQGLTEAFEGRPDPLLGRIFGALVTAPGGQRLDARRLRSPKATEHRFDVLVRTEHPSEPLTWLERTTAEQVAIEESSRDARRRAHDEWWNAFWRRSWIHVTAAAATDPVPSNAHPVRIGEDPDGHHRFVGEIGWLRWLDAPVDEAQRKRWAGDRHEREAERDDVRLSLEAPVEAGALDGSANWGFADGLTIEAWLCFDALPAGGVRLVDKITPGSGDGLLFDTHPSNGLRLIVGSRQVSAEGVLTLGRWTHVAASVDSTTGELALFVDGREVASTGGALNDAEVVSRAYALQRFVTACAGRGRYPIKFNGSLFTVPHEGAFGDADYRRWGPGYWWQNTRLPYLSACTSGDFELLEPLFRMYAEEQMPIHEFRTRAYTGHGGAFIPECVYFFGSTFAQTYGWKPFDEREDKLQESPWHKWEWVSGLELVWMMCEYAEHTENAQFVREKLVPTAERVLSFFAEHYERDGEGKLVMTPSQALETWWDCTNPMPEVAGLRAVSRRLLALPEAWTDESDRASWSRILELSPELPVWEHEGSLRLAPAARFADKRNVENPELYAVHPFRLVTFATEGVELGRRALADRWDRGSSGWRQDDLFMTHLGLADDARVNLVSRARNVHDSSRFPGFFGPNYDWTPDQTHGGVLMRTLQTMLMQTDGRTVHLLPAWPRGWDAEFRLWAPFGTCVEGRVEGGRLVSLEVTPEARRAEVRVVGQK